MDAKSDIYFLLFPAHAADDARTLWRIHSGTLYKARAGCKMVCKEKAFQNFQFIQFGKTMFVTAFTS
jgi:hypothetical protein